MAALVGVISSTVLSSAEGGYQTGGGGTLPGSYVSLAGHINGIGVILDDISVTYPGGACKLIVNKGTTALDKDGLSMMSILISKLDSPPAPPTNANIIGLAYDFQPAGATFNPPITLTFTYQPSDIPQGKNEKDLVIAFYDGSKWVNLTGPFSIDAANHIISSPVSHFTAFSILAFPPALTPVVAPTPTVTPTTPPVSTPTPTTTVPPTQVPTIAPTTAATTVPPITPPTGGTNLWLVIRRRNAY